MKQTGSTNYMYLELVLEKKTEPRTRYRDLSHLRHSIVESWMCPDIKLRGPDPRFGGRPRTRER